MTMPRKKTMHAQLDQHRQRVAAEGMNLRELQEQQARAKAELERIGDTIAAAYASEDGAVIAKARKAKEEAMGRVEDLEHHVAGAELRARRAREELQTFTAEHARELLEEREPVAREAATALTSAVAEVVKARARYDDERSHIDELVSQVPDASTRFDGVPTSYAWADALRELERAYKQAPEAPVPRPRWAGQHYRQNMNAVHQRLQQQRRGGNDVVEAVRPPAER
jgi:hypothetical protein